MEVENSALAERTTERTRMLRGHSIQADLMRLANCPAAAAGVTPWTIALFPPRGPAVSTKPLLTATAADADVEVSD